MTSERVSDERLAEMLDGLEGVTLAPRESLGSVQLRRFMGWSGDEGISILTELQSLRRSSGVTEQMLIDAFLRGESWRKRNDVDRYVAVPEMVNKAARDYADATLSTTPHLRRSGGVAATGLEWKDGYGAKWPPGVNPSALIRSAYGSGVHYTIHVNKLGGFILLISEAFRSIMDAKKLPFDSEETAKAAAQADYERRILSALSPAPEGEPFMWLTPHDYREMRVPASSNRTITGWRQATDKQGCNLVPLYASPPEPVVTDGVLEKLNHALMILPVPSGGREKRAWQSLLEARSALTAALKREGE